jgi:hypothetical protein
MKNRSHALSAAKREIERNRRLRLALTWNLAVAAQLRDDKKVFIERYSQIVAAARRNLAVLSRVAPLSR